MHIGENLRRKSFYRLHFIEHIIKTKILKKCLLVTAKYIDKNINIFQNFLVSQGIFVKHLKFGC